MKNLHLFESINAAENQTVELPTVITVKGINRVLCGAQTGTKTIVKNGDFIKLVSNTNYTFNIEVQDYSTLATIETKEYAFTPSNSGPLTITIESDHNYVFKDYTDAAVTKYNLIVDTSTGKILSNDNETFEIEENISVIIYRLTMP